MASSEKKLTLEKVLQGIEELRLEQKETGRQLKETGQHIKELRESQRETDRQLKETDRQLKKTDARFSSEWGKLVESLVEGDLVQQLQHRNIEVKATVRRIETHWNGKKYEFDIAALNGSEMVVVEVKTTLTPKKAKHFTDKLKNFKHIFPDYKDKKIYGAVAYLKVDSQADIYAENQGLFVIRATGNSSSIINAENFTPVQF